MPGLQRVRHRIYDVLRVVPANFRQVEAPQVYATVYAWLTGGSQFVNQADVGGVYNGTWVQAISRWVTTVYGKPPRFPVLAIDPHSGRPFFGMDALPLYLKTSHLIKK